MKKFLFAVSVVALSLLVSCATVTYEEPVPEENQMNPFEAVYWVDTGTNDMIGVADLFIDALNEYNLLTYHIGEREYLYGDAATGTCFAISDHELLTNQHVIDGMQDIYILADGYYEPVEVVYEDYLNDVAILRVDFPLSYYFTIDSSSEVKKGDYACILGYPLSDILGSTGSTFTEGVINSLSGIDDNPLEFQLSAGIQSGNSGSPVMNSDFHVIGIASATLSDQFMLEVDGQTGQNVNFAIKSDLVKMICSDFVQLKKSKLKEVNSLEKADKAVFMVYAENPYYTSMADLGSEEYLIRVSYVCSWNDGYADLDEVKVSIVNSEDREIFAKTYYGWESAEDVHFFLEDLDRYMDRSGHSYGYEDEAPQTV